MNCPGSVQMAKHYPEQESQDALEGDAAHEIAAAMLKSYRLPPGELLYAPDQFVGKSASNGVIITRDIFEGARLYVNDVLQACEDHGAADKLLVEEVLCATQRVHLHSYGHLDAGFYHYERGVLKLWDFKFGFLPVPAFENWQLINYYAGMLERFEINGLEDQLLDVEFTVVQPRDFNNPIKRWKVIGSDLRGHINRLHTAAHEAMSGGAKTRSGSWCRYCPARHGCASARDAALAGVEYIHQAQPHDLTDDALSFEIATLQHAKKAVEYRLEALEEEAMGRLREGKRVHGFKLKHGSGKRRWVPGREAAIRALAKFYKVDLDKEPELVTVAEAERRLKPKFKEQGQTESDVKAAIEGLYEIPTTGLKLVQDDGTDARRIFTQQET